ncbi:hypothetical protein OH76DRAFT_544367 [Lentinus brumalis]|uniref:Uncharacterized protein n=1 Tax=Lentinus brumalis TaxID=2498619 RepID=A0A371D9X1_9APHY|nr:hypothetical protein OH76DRAFT_544367 [Polyporus brumalis]
MMRRLITGMDGREWKEEHRVVRRGRPGIRSEREKLLHAGRPRQPPTGYPCRLELSNLRDFDRWHGGPGTWEPCCHQGEVDPNIRARLRSALSLMSCLLHSESRVDGHAWSDRTYSEGSTRYTHRHFEASCGDQPVTDIPMSEACATTERSSSRLMSLLSCRERCTHEGPGSSACRNSGLGGPETRF